jgi:hypothetical protein
MYAGRETIKSQKQDLEEANQITGILQIYHRFSALCSGSIDSLFHGRRDIALNSRK